MNSLKTEVVSGIYPHSDSKIGRITNDKTVMLGISNLLF